MQPTHTHPNEPYGTTAGTYNTSYPAGATAPTTTTTYPTGHTAHTGEKPSMMEKAKHAVGMGRHGSGSSSSSSDSDNEAKRHTGHTATPAVATHGISQPGGAHYSNPVTQHATFANTGTPTGHTAQHESLVDKAKHAVGMDKHHSPANAGYTSTATPAGVHQTHGTGYSYAGAPQPESMVDKAKHAVGLGTTPHHTETHPATYATTGTVEPMSYGTTGTQATGYGHGTTGYPTAGTHTTPGYDTTGTHTTGYGNTATGTGTAAHKPTMMEKVKGKVEQVVDTAKGAVGGNKHKTT